MKGRGELLIVQNTQKQPFSCEFFKKKFELFFTEEFKVTATIHT